MRYYMRLCPIFLAFFCVFECVCAGDVYQDLANLADKVEAGYKQREEALTRSMGKAHFSISKEMTSDNRENSRNRGKEFINSLKELGLDPAKVRSDGGNEVTVEWYRNGGKYRYDMDVKRLDGSAVFYPRSTISNAESSDVHIYYSILDNIAYINTVKQPGELHISQIERFDLDYVYKTGDDYVYNSWRKWLKNIPNQPSTISKENDDVIEIQITEDDDVICVYIQKTIDKGDGYTRSLSNKMYFSKEKQYATIKYTNSNKSLKDGVQLSELHSEFSVSYEINNDSGLWLAKEMKRHTENGIDVVDVHVVFDEIHLGVDVPDEMFTFAGMGVPEGATIYDLRESGPPKEYRNNLGVYVGLNGIDLSAGAIDTAPPTPEPQPSPPTPIQAPLSPPVTPPATAAPVQDASISRFVIFFLAVLFVLILVVCIVLLKKRNKSS